MRSYNRSDRSGSRRGGGGGFRRRDSGPREMFGAVCDQCGKDCEVPFRPSGDKPIYCSDCFEGKENGGSRRTSRRGSDECCRQLDAKLDKILALLEPKKTAKKEIKKEVEESEESK